MYALVESAEFRTAYTECVLSLSPVVLIDTPGSVCLLLAKEWHISRN